MIQNLIWYIEFSPVCIIIENLQVNGNTHIEIDNFLYVMFTT
jgi:hypothetical protein